jgi:hypothetical protein
MQADQSTANGQGSVKRYQPGGVISGTGKVIRADGEVVEFTLQSDPLTPDQADKLNQKQE